MSNKYTKIFKLFEEVYGFNLSIGISNLTRIINENHQYKDKKARVEKQRAHVAERIESLKSAVGAADVFKLYIKAVIIQNKLIGIQREILKSKVSPLQWEDKTLSILNDIYRKIKGIDEHLSSILKEFGKIKEPVPASVIKEFQDYVCNKEYTSCRFAIVNAIKAFNHGEYPETRETCGVPEFGDLEWPEKMFTHRYRTVPSTTILPHRFEIDNTESPLIYGQRGSGSTKTKVAANQVLHYLNEAQRYNNYGLTHKYNLSPKDRLDGYNLKLQLENSIDKETEKSQKNMFAGVTVADAKNPLRFIRKVGTRAGPLRTHPINYREGKGPVQIVIKMADGSQSLVTDLSGNTSWQDLEYIPNYLGIVSTVGQDFGFKFNKYYSIWLKINGDPIAIKQKETDEDESAVAPDKNKMKGIYTSLNNRLLKSNFRGQMYSASAAKGLPNSDAIQLAATIVEWYERIST